MAIRKTQQGFALLIAVIFMAVMLSLGVALGSLGYKQETLASTGVESQYAFYAADAALECILYYDQRENSFAYQPPNPPPSQPSVECDGAPPVSSSIVAENLSYWELTYRFLLDNNTGNPRCADVTIYKYATALPNGITTYIFSQGYNVACNTVTNSNGVNFVSSGLDSHY